MKKQWKFFQEYVGKMITKILYSSTSKNNFSPKKTQTAAKNMYLAKKKAKRRRNFSEENVSEKLWKKESPRDECAQQARIRDLEGFRE
jgi:hypothetical protein